MQILPTKIDPQSEEYRANAEAMQALVQDLESQLAHARQGGSKALTSDRRAGQSGHESDTSRGASCCHANG